MTERLTDRWEKQWVLLHAGACFALFLYYLLWQVNFYLAETLLYTVMPYGMALLVVLYFCFRRLKDGWEMRLLLAFWLWYLLTRVLTGDIGVEGEFVRTLELLIGFLFLPLGLLLNRKQREHLLDLVCVVTGLFYFVLGVLALYVFLMRTELINPITEGYIAYASENEFTRLAVMDQNPNVTGLWFMMGFFLMIYAFSRSKKLYLRIPIVLAGIVDYLCIALSYSRNTKFTVSVGLAMLVVLLLLRRFKEKKKNVRIIAVVLAMVVMVPCVYESFNVSAELFGKWSASVTESDSTSEEESEPKELKGTSASSPALLGAHVFTNENKLSSTAKENAWVDEPDENGEWGYGPWMDAVEDPDQPEGPWADPDLEMETSFPSEEPKLFTDTRGLKSVGELNGRIYIYQSIPITFQSEPLRMLIGSSEEDLMHYTNEMPRYKDNNREMQHMHNSWLQALMLTGIPGFLLTAAFTVLLVRRMIRFYFSKNPKAALQIKILTIPVTAVLMYHLLETGIFIFTDVRACYFFLLAGMVIAWSRELEPGQKKSRPKEITAP